MKTSHVSYSTLKGSRSKIFPDVNRAEVARKLHVTRSHVSRILSGHVEPSMDVMVRLSEIFGIRIEDLLRRIQEAKLIAR